MERYPKKARLRDGREVTLRPMVESDLEGLVAFFKSLPAEDRLFLKSDVTNREVIEKWVKNIDYNSVLPILATADDAIVADATLHLNQHGWQRKSGEIRCVVARSYQGSGLGTLLVGELVQHAAARGIERLMSQMTTDQQEAIKVFQRVGFKREAVLRRHVVDVEGNWRDLVIMTNNTSDIWREMEDLLMNLDVRRG